MFDGPLSGETEKSMCAYLVIWTGDKASEFFESFTFMDQEKNKTEPYLREIQKIYCTTWFGFHKREQLENRSVENFITENSEETGKTMTICWTQRDHIVIGQAEVSSLQNNPGSVANIWMKEIACKKINWCSLNRKCYQPPKQDKTQNWKKGSVTSVEEHTLQPTCVQLTEKAALNSTNSTTLI